MPRCPTSTTQSVCCLCFFVPVLLHKAWNTPLNHLRPLPAEAGYSANRIPVANPGRLCKHLEHRNRLWKTRHPFWNRTQPPNATPCFGRTKEVPPQQQCRSDTLTQAAARLARRSIPQGSHKTGSSTRQSVPVAHATIVQPHSKHQHLD